MQGVGAGHQVRHALSYSTFSFLAQGVGAAPAGAEVPMAEEDMEEEGMVEEEEEVWTCQS